jgi:AcrR family transcriptional regulator
VTRPPARSPERAPVALAGQAPAERADAARNRRRILEATRSLVDGHGAQSLTVAAVARAAGVGPATVIRRFGDKAGLLMALLDEQERELQEAMLRGPPPLGPGAPARERVYAFLDALVALTDANADILLASETVKAGARYRTGAYSAWRQHLALLLGEARPGLDARLVAHLLLAPLAAESYDQLRRVEQRSRGEIQAALRAVAAGALRDPAPARSTDHDHGR